MARRYFLTDLPGPGPCRLDDELAHHLGGVLRSRPGDVVRLADGRGHSALATVTRAERRCVELEVGEAEFRPRPDRSIHLAFALPRHNRTEWLFEHATEVGVAVFWPLQSERVRPQGDRSERWHKIAAAAAGQCDRDWLPEIRTPLSLAEFLRQDDLPARRWLATAGGPKDAAPATEALLLVGPEGGWTAAERAAAEAADFAPLGLGPHVLRTETAALVGAALLLQ